MRFSSLLLLALGLGTAVAQAPTPASVDPAGDLLRQGITAQQHGDLRTAIEDYRKALALNPNSPEARANLGAALAAAGDLDGAIAEDTRALANAPDKTSVRRNLALAYYKKGDWRNARTQFETVHAARPGDLATAMLLGYSEIKLQQPTDAVALLLPLEPGNQSNMDFEYVLGFALILSGRETEGLPRMEKMARATQSPDAWLIAGSTRLHRREFHEARAALAINPSVPGLYTMVGQARDALGDTEAAQPAFEAALRQDPRDFYANLYLGTMRLKARDMDHARPLLELALKLQPGNPQARLQMAKLNGMTGKYAEAAATLEDLEKADPNWLDPHIELAPLYDQRERDIVQQIEAKQQ
jgi:tetratricopeptide (TPR) repeat protein